MANFEKTFVSTNVKPGAPAYDPKILVKLYDNLIQDAPELKPIAYPLLGAVVIGAHRPDLVPKLFENATAELESEADIKSVFDQFRSVFMCVWPFVGIPWCVPAALGLVNVLKTHGVEHIGVGRTRPDINNDVDKEAGAIFRERAYKAVKNEEVQTMLRTYFADFAELGWTVVFGYSLAGTATTGIFKDYETQLILASAVTASGATRQARSHGQGAIGIGNSVVAVKAIFKAADDINEWNGTSVTPIDVDELGKAAAEVLASLKAAE